MEDVHRFQTQESPRKLSEECVFRLHVYARYRQEALRFADPPDRTLRIISTAFTTYFSPSEGIEKKGGNVLD